MQQKWEDFYKSHNFFHLEPHEGLSAFAQKCQDNNYYSVLDLGCGTGADLLFLAERGFNVTGVEYSPSAASNAEDLLQSKGYEGKVYVDNLFDKVTTFSNNEFPAILAINSLEYTDRDTFNQCIADIARILKEGGLLFLVVSSEKSLIKPIPDLEQIFFEEDEITSQAGRYFQILDFFVDKNENYCLVLEKKNHDKNH